MNGVAYAVVRFDPPAVYLAEDIEVLQRLLALELVADTDPADSARAKELLQKSVRENTGELERLRGEIAALYAQMVDLLRETGFASARIGTVKDQLRGLAKELRRHGKRARQISSRFSMKPDAFRATAALSTRNSKKGREALANLGGNAERVREGVEQLEEVARAVHRLEADAGMTRAEVLSALESLRDGRFGFTKARAGPRVVLAEDALAGAEPKMSAADMRQTLNKLMDIREQYNLPRVCSGQASLRH